MVAAVIVVLDESADAGLEVAWQIVVLQQDAVMTRLVFRTFFRYQWPIGSDLFLNFGCRGFYCQETLSG